MSNGKPALADIYERWKQSGAGDTGTTTTQKSGNEGVLSDIYDRWKQSGGQILSVQEPEESIDLSDINERINALIQKQNTAADQYNARFSTRTGTYEDSYVTDAQSWLDGIKQQREDYQNEAARITATLEQNGQYLDQEWVQAVKDAVRSGQDMYDEMITNAQRDVEYWGQWSDESAYKQWAHQEEVRTTARDKDTVKRELDATKKAVAGYKGNTSLMAALEHNAEINEDVPVIDQASVNPVVQGDISAYKELPALMAKLQALQEEYDWSQYNYYANFSNAADFAEKSVYVPQERKKQRTLDVMLDNYSNDASGWEDPLYEYVNGNEEAGAYIGTAGSYHYGADNPLGAFLGRATESKTESRQMEPQEVATFNYLYATEGKGAAHAYYEYLLSDLYARQRKDEEKYWTQQAAEDSAGTSIFSIAMAPFKGLSYIGQLTDYMTTGKIDENAPYNSFSYVNSAIRNQVSKQIEKSGKWGKVGSFAYQTGMSMGDFLMTAAVSGGNQVLSLAIMGTGAAADTTIAAKERGLSDGQAFSLGTIAGAAEVLAEKLQIDALLSRTGLGKTAIGYVVQNALAEGGEEGATSIANMIADILISKEKSEWQRSIDAYKAAGKNESEAFGLALADQAISLGLDVAGGMLSGTALGGGSAILSDIAARIKGHQLGKMNLTQEGVQGLVDKGLENPANTRANFLAEKFQKKLADGKQLSNYDLGRQYQANAKEGDTGLDFSAEVMRQLTNRANENTAPKGGSIVVEGLRLPSLEGSKQTPSQIVNNTQTMEEANVPTGVPLSVADQLRQNKIQNGGIQYDSTQRTVTGSAPAQPAGVTEHTNGAGISDGGKERNAGTGTAKQAGVLASSPEQRRGAYADRSRATVARQNYARSLRLEKVSSLDLGLQNGTESKNIQVMPQEHWDTEMSQLADRIYNETGKRVTYVMGRIQIRGVSGAVEYARGVIAGDRIIVQADNLRISMEQIADHEAYHAKVDFAADNRLNLNAIIKQHILDTFSAEQFQQVLDKYIEGLRGVIDVNEARTGEQFEDMVRQVEEEIFADAYAGINAFGANADQFTDAVNEKMDRLYMGKIRNQDNGTEKPTGPPESRYSIDDQSGSVKQQVVDNQDVLNAMDPVAKISVPYGFFQLDKAGKQNWVAEKLRSTGYRVDRIGFGVIEFARKHLKSAFNYFRKGGAEEAVFEALPHVLENGIEISAHTDHKGRSYGTVTIAAPVIVNGKRGNMAVVVKRTTANYYKVHRILSPDGSVFILSETTEEAEPTSGGGVTTKGPLATPISSASNNTIQKQGKNVKPRFSYAGNNANDIDRDALTMDTEMQVAGVAAESDHNQEQKPALKKKIRPVAESKPLIAKQDLRKTVLSLFSVPSESRDALGTMIDFYADRLIKNGSLTEEDRKAFFDRVYDAGVMSMPASDYYAEARNYLRDGRIYVPDSVVLDLGDDWNDIRRRAFSAGIYLTRSQALNGRSVAGIDVWNDNLASELPGLFDTDETDQRSILERIIQVAEEGRDEKMSLTEYTARLAEREDQSENEFLDNMERQLDWALRTFAEKAKLEVYLRDRTGRKITQEREKGAERMTKQRAREAQHRADEREARKDSARRARERRELRELQQRTLKQLQWLSKNRNRAPEELKATWDEVLGDIDIYAVSAADEMHWSDKHNATWKDLAQMYKDAMKNDPNFLPSKELERIVARLDGTKIAEMDIGALQDLYKAAIGLRTEFYNRNNVINDEMQRLFAEVYTDAKREIESAPGGFTGNLADKILNLDQLTPMNVLQRMAGWDPAGAFYSMAKQLERGERDMRSYSVKAQKMLQDFLTEHEDWVKIADGQGKDAIWYEVEVPQLLELHMGDKPIFGPTVKVYMTPAQKVHMFLESKNLDNLRHMTGGRTFVDKELYSKGKRQEALSQGRTIKLAPETVRQLVADITPEEMELARVLDAYYNTFATREINRVSNILYGYDKAMGKNYAPIYTNRNYTKTEFGVFDVTAEGVGNLKGRQYAVNPSYNISAFDAFERHVDQTARFCGMAIPARNWTTLMNWREKNNSTGDVITHKWGEVSKRYISDLITTLQGGDDAKSDTISSAFSKLQSNYISAIFGANPSIVLKQLGSIPLAGAYLDARNMPTPAQIAGIDRGLISRYTQELEWRTMGYTTPETKQLKENPNWTQTNKVFKFVFGGGAITAMDGWAASTLWPWAENKVRREHPELAVGTKAQVDAGESAFYKKVAEEFENAISRSQSVSDEIHQGTLRKSKNPITKAFTMFRSDSAQTYNALRQKIGEAQFYMRTGEKDKVIRTAKKAVGTAFVAMLLNAAWAEAVNLLVALWKNQGKYYRDDEDELTFESVAGEVASGMLGSFAGVITGGEETLEIIGNILTGEKIYDIEAPGLEQLNDLIDTITSAGGTLRDLVAGGWDVLKNSGDLGEYFSKHSGQFLGGVKELAAAAAMYLRGLPASNLEAYLIGALKLISPELGAAYDDLFSDPGKSDLTGMEGSALEGRVSRILSDRNVSESDDTAAALATLYEAGYKMAIPSDTPKSVSINNEERALGAYQQQTYDTIWGTIVADALDDIVESDSFAEADSKTQAKMLNNLYTYAAERTKAELFDEYEMKSGAIKKASIIAAGITTAECITAYSKYSEINDMDLNANMKAVEFSHWINNRGYTAEQAAIVKDELTYFNMTPASSGRYDKLVGSGMDADDAYDLTGTLNELQPEDGGNDVSNVQKWRAVIDSIGDEEEQISALSTIMSESQHKKVQTAYSFGITPDVYVQLAEIKPQFDADGNGHYTQAEVKAAIDAMNTGWIDNPLLALSGQATVLTTERKAILWQIVTGATTAKNNPYSVAAGQRVLNSKETSENTGMLSWSEELMRQLTSK